MKDYFCRASYLEVLILIFLTATLATAQKPAARITQQIDPTQSVTLQGNTHPLARAQFDRGPAPDSMIADRMMLVLSRSDEQEKALQQLLDDQQTAGSPNFHKWLTPEEFGQQFGPSDTDIQTITTWLLNNGFQVTHVSAGKNVIEFSGTTGQLRQVFHADLHKYVVNGEEHWANANDPQIPAALAPVVKGIASLNNFGRRPQSHNVQAFKRDVSTGEASPLMTSGGSPAYYLIGPGDFGVIYNSSPLLQAGNDGSGQKIAIAGRTNINLQDVTDFRNFFGLSNTPDNHTTVILNGPDPGIIPGDETEALLDVEWSGAVAPGAQIVLVTTESTLTADGIDLSSLYIVENNLAPVMSVSYGSCESGMGNAGNLFYRSLWEQAAAQGITVNVAAGDNGSAGCDNPNTETVATKGTAVNGIASTPFNIAVGGTDFNDSTTQTTYFNSTNTAGTWTSAKSYIPEMPWNDSCAGGTAPTTSSCSGGSNLRLWSGSGGPSNCSTLSGSTCSGYAKPSWQTGTGVPSDGVRDLPDISLFAASGSAGSRSLYVMCEADKVPGNPSCQNPGPGGGYVYLVTIAGTSASSPAFAGAVALANQKVNHRLGNLNYLLYSLAAQSGNICPSSSSTSTCVFHDVTIGSNSVPCQGGTPKCSVSTGNGVLVDSGKLAYLSTAGYDRATGLGTPNINNLVNSIATKLGSFTPTTTTLTLNGGNGQVNASHGQAINVVVGVSPTAATGDVSLIGNNSTSDNSGFDFFKLTSGAASWSSTLFPGGTYTVHAHYPGDGSRGASDSSAISVNIAPENSKTFVNLVTPSTFTATAAEYGSPYILRMDVGDSAATISSSSGVSSKCSNGTASCPTGTLTVTANGNPLDGGSWKLNNQGHSEDQPIQLVSGTYNIVANYPGDASYNASTGTAAITINKATTAFTVTQPSGPYRYGTALPISGTLTSSSNGAAPGGTVTWLDNGADAASSIQFPYYSPSAGSPSTFAGATYGAAYIPPSMGTHTLTGQYSGDSNYATATATAFTVTVTQASMTANVTNISPSVATPNIPVTIYVRFYSQSQIGTPTGTITFSDNGTPISGSVTYSSQVGQIAGSMTLNFAQAGQHTITAAYSGDTYYSAATLQVGAIDISDKLTASLQPSTAVNPALINYPTTLTAMIDTPDFGLPTPTGTVTFVDNGQTLSGTVTYTGSSIVVATMPYTFTSSGTHTIVVNYSGDNNYAPASTSFPVTVVDKYSTSIPYLNESNNVAIGNPTILFVNINSSVVNQGPIMTGTVTLLDGQAPITATQTVTNQYGSLGVQVPYTFTTAGAHSVTVQYGGDDHYAASSRTFTVDVMNAVSIQFLGSDPLTIGSSGGSSSTYVRLYNNTSTTQTITLTCQPDSSAATCSMNPTGPSVAANSTNDVTINFTVPANVAALRNDHPFRIPWLLATVLFGICFVTRKSRTTALMVLTLALMAGMISCGGGSSSTPLPPTPHQGSKTYKFTITATAGAYSDSRILTVVVQGF